MLRWSIALFLEVERAIQLHLLAMELAMDLRPSRFPRIMLRFEVFVALAPAEAEHLTDCLSPLPVYLQQVRHHKVWVKNYILSKSKFIEIELRSFMGLGCWLSRGCGDVSTIVAIVIVFSTQL